MAGASGILSFPFRIYASEPLPLLKVPFGRGTARIHEPITVRPSGMPLSPDVPFAEWPNFQWAPSLPERKRLRPPAGASARPESALFYDALRVDVRSDQNAPALSSFIDLFLAWLRHLSKQPWIGAYEPQSDVWLKYGFRCDSEGRANETPWAGMKATTFSSWMQLVSSDTWQRAGELAGGGDTPPAYWAVFLDAQMQRDIDNAGQCLLLLALSLEIARDQNYTRFANTFAHPLFGSVLAAPFNDTDLLKHLSGRLEVAHPGSRNLEAELPDEWQGVVSIYVARHHVAHGRPPVIRDGPGVRLVTDNDLRELIGITYRVLQWVEAL